jgi:fructose-1-phosphate kinase PfkB-like protein
VDGYARIVALAAEAGARTAVDADGEVLARAVVAGAWLARATPTRPHAPPGSARAARQKRSEPQSPCRTWGRITLVSRGIEGTIVLDEAGMAWRVGPSPERGAYPVGSGDSALAGFLAAIAAGATTEEAARHAVAAGTANALRPGQGEIDPTEVARILPAVTLAPIGQPRLGRRDGDDVTAPGSDPTHRHLRSEVL